MSFVYLSDVTHNLFQRTIFNFAHTPWNTFIFLPFKPCEISTPRRFFLFLETKSMTLFIKGVLFCIPLMPLFQSSSSFSYFFSFFLSFNQRLSVPFDVREKRCSPWDKCDNGSAFIFFSSSSSFERSETISCKFFFAVKNGSQMMKSLFKMKNNDCRVYGRGESIYCEGM